MNDTPKFNEMPSFEFVFIKEKMNQSFLKQGINLSSSTWGKPLNEFISLEPHEFDGALLNEKTIPKLTKQIYTALINTKKQKLQIKNNELFLYIYTLCKLDQVIIFNVWKFVTKSVTQERTECEKEYGRTPYSCCQELYRQQNNLSKQENIILSHEIFDKYCQYKKSYVDCNVEVFSHFFNIQDQQAREFVEDCDFNFMMTLNFKVNSLGQCVFFRYDNMKYPTSLRCTSLYDSLLFDNTVTPPIEHNFQNFLSDALFTCFGYQKQFTNLTHSIKTQEQRLVCVSLFLDSSLD